MSSNDGAKTLLPLPLREGVGGGVRGEHMSGDALEFAVNPSP